MSQDGALDEEASPTPCGDGLGSSVPSAVPEFTEWWSAMGWPQGAAVVTHPWKGSPAQPCWDRSGDSGCGTVFSNTSPILHHPGVPCQGTEGQRLLGRRECGILRDTGTGGAVGTSQGMSPGCRTSPPSVGYSPAASEAGSKYIEITSRTQLDFHMRHSKIC